MNQFPQSRVNRWYTLTCEYLREFSKKFEMTLMLFSGAWGKVIHDKNLKSKKSRDTVPLSGSIMGTYYCAAGFALLNLPKGKSLGRSKPETNSSNEQPLATHCVGFLLYPSSVELPYAK